MRAQSLTTVCAAALFAAIGFTGAYAEPAGTEGGPAATGAQQAAPGNMAPSSPDAQKTPDGTKPGDGRAAAKPDGAPGKAQMGDKGPMSGNADRDADHRDAATDRDGMSEKDRNRAAESREDRDHDGNAGDRKHGKTAKFEARDKQKVRTYFSEHHPNAKRVSRTEVSVSIGVGIPGSIALYPLPAGIVVVAADCPLQYFLWGPDVVIVDSCSREVVDIVPDIG